MPTEAETTKDPANADAARKGAWPPPAAIGDYGIIGNGRSTALVSRYGRIDWLCWPRFDSPSVLGGILDPKIGGSWIICPAEPATVRRKYLERTNILETRFCTSTGAAVLTDFMPVASEERKHSMLWPEQELVRLLKCDQGKVEISFDFEPRPGYGQTPVNIVDCKGLGYRFNVGTSVITLLSELPLNVVDSARLKGSLQLEAGQRAAFSLTHSEEAPAVLAPLGAAVDYRLGLTRDWWHEWVDRAHYAGPYRDLVERSALTLKLLSFSPSGAIVAAPTMSLPERIGGELNWDYRYCWLRDAAFTARALYGLGYRDEAESFVSWMLHATRLTRPELRIMYDVYGERPPRETELKTFIGYADSRPVRLGNAARDQVQLDVYGEVIDAVSHFVRSGGELDREVRKMLCQFGKYVCRHWQDPDHGIWEERGAKRHYTHSKLLSWVALDRLLQLAEAGQLPKLDLQEMEVNRDRIRQDIEASAWDANLDSYVRYYSGDTVDATLLLMGLHGFQDPALPRLQQTYRRITQKLAPKKGLMYRYEEGAAAGEGAFAICSFWQADFVARGGGTAEEAHNLFRVAAEYRNDLGLFAEEIDPETGAPLGNFPQAFTHLGLINAAISLANREEHEARVAAGANTGER